ncbi:MAG TPA: PhoU domain-containing protein, partial [Bradyrhizobium sp.]|nr:PhoU domain-containing protein [Bradyrhizobium sp.]
AASNADWTHAPGYYVILTDQPGEKSWPITASTFILMHKNPTAICTSLFRELLTYMMEDPRNISFCIHLMFCAKNIERIGDHATNIAETVFYMIEGQQILDKRPKGDMTTFATTVPGN